MGGFQDDRRRHPGIQSLRPSADTEAPTVSGGEAGKAELRMGCDQVVASRARELQKLRRHDRADGVQSDIARAGPTKAIAIESRSRLEAAAL
jgi:hypothetical protein